MTRKITKKTLALLLVVLMLCSLCACKNGSSQKGNRINEYKNTASDTVTRAQALIDKGKYEEAYTLLMDTENADAIALRNKLVFVPMQVICSGEITSRTLTFTYSPDYNTAVLTDGSGNETTICDDDGNVLTMETIDSDGDRSTTTYTYDENDDCVMIKKNNPDGSWTKNTYTRDKNGNVLTNVCTSDSGFESTHAYTYDTNGNLLAEEYTSNGNLIQRRVCTYDQKGNLLTEESFSNGNTYRKYIFTYDENGYPKSEEYTDEKGNRRIINITYDQNGKLLREECSDSNHLQATYSYIYDAFGNLLTVDISSKSEDIYLSNSITWKLCYYSDGAPDVIQYFSRLAKLNVLVGSYIVRRQNVA